MGSLNLNLGLHALVDTSRTGEVVAYCSYLVLLLSLTMVVSSYLVLLAMVVSSYLVLQ